MKKLLTALLVTFIICGTSGCRSSRTTVRTDTEVKQTVITDSSRTETASTSEKIQAVLSSNEQQNVVIDFEEWEYYPVSDTITGGYYAHNSGNNIREGSNEVRPPDAGSLKKHRKGKITISSEKQTETNSTVESEQATETSVQASSNVSTEAQTKNSEKVETGRKGSKAVVWIVVGLICAVVFVGLGIYLAKKR